MSKNKNRNLWNNPDQNTNDTLDASEVDFTDFDVEENNQQEPSPEETKSIQVQEPIQATPVVEPQPINHTENKEETMPTTEVKHQEVTPAATPDTTTVVTPKNVATRRFHLLTKKYIDLAKNGIQSEDVKKQAVGVLNDIVYLVTTSHDRAVFDACLSFFLSNRGIMMSEQTVIGSVSHYADPTKINRIVQFYVIFISLVESKILRKRYTININHVRDIFNNRKFAEWLADKR